MVYPTPGLTGGKVSDVNERFLSEESFLGGQWPVAMTHGEWCWSGMRWCEDEDEDALVVVAEGVYGGGGGGVGGEWFEEKAVSHLVLIIMWRDLEHLKVGRLERRMWGLSTMSASGFHFAVSRRDSAISTASKCGSWKPSGCENPTQS